MDFLEQGYFKENNWVHFLPPSPQKVEKMITQPIKLYAAVLCMI